MATERPWYRPHRITWVVIAVVIWGVAAQVCDPGRRRSVDLDLATTLEFFECGWPIDAVQIIETHDWIDASTLRCTDIAFDFYGGELLLDLIVCSWLVVSTGFVCERLRSARHPQFTLRQLVLVTFVVCVLLTLGVHGIPQGNITHADPDNLWYLLKKPSWWPVLFAIGCTIYSFVCLIKWEWSLARRPR